MISKKSKDKAFYSTDQRLGKKISEGTEKLVNFNANTSDSSFDKTNEELEETLNCLKMYPSQARLANRNTSKMSNSKRQINCE